MTAPDPGLTDLIAAALVRSSPNSIDTFDDLAPHRQEAWRVRAREVALVVEQHTNGRMAELEAERDSMAANYVTAIGLRDIARDRAEKDEDTIARVEKLAHDMRGWCSPHGISVTYSDRILATLEGES
ncbi:hypothetical protein [Rhodococcus sp. (in: high G+C Gram-positive bacteria)]|uniref:hypothetical protein n=1 Tax=Rhodococcus sp. TaxID=1831 RepID=UPI00257A82E1|nr:hypothetical protein [Rhodococcus sp. (in: high G+C Gram-positive bacteria)]MBQ9051726.1 hypothetical protein [Rhodococcus sp. (in: high G+C Gram-positive bacteria)]